MPNPVELHRPATPAEAGPAAKPAPPAGAPRVAASADRVASDVAVTTSGPLRGIRYGRELAAAAAHYGLDPVLVAAVAAQESGGPGAINGDARCVQPGGGGRGLMQLDAAWHALARSKGALDPAKNADEGAHTLRNNLHQQHGDTRAALQQYNTGSPTSAGAASTWPDGRVLHYADSVARHYDDSKAYVEQHARH